MDWEEARTGTLREWRRIRASIEEADEITLLADINAVCDLCRVASEEAIEAGGRCESCLAFRQFGGCQDASLAMSELVMDEDWDGLRGLIDEFITALADLETDNGRGDRPVTIGG